MESTTPNKEVRFAVVMYGGVSLAIYINGIVQELFKMVRATATKSPGSATPLIPYDELSGSERVYRRLGQMLGREGREQHEPLCHDSPISTKFVVDILSGTSAGGINAVYLAKALANGQDVQQLSELWVDEGDIAKLINDKESVDRVDGLKKQRPPRSLLNGQRMYRKLLDAFDGMEKEKPSRAGVPSPYVEELDLFVTATDFHGLPVPLRLADKVVEELRHRNVYHLQYRGPADEFRNDFLATNNPFLAFAARSTSAFPFAFDPIKLADTKTMLDTTPDYRDLPEAERDPKRWRTFFPDYRLPDFPDRAFVDGGYLDNKPFGYATDVLASRRSNAVPVDRKLIYIEPAPEHVEDKGRTGEIPNAIENVAAVFSLARYETIREDLQRILYRNRLIERVETVTSKMEEDVRNGRRSHKPVNIEDFDKRDLKVMIDAEGVAYGGYQRIKIGAVCDEITEMIARAAGLDPGSDQFFAIRHLVRAWKEENYAAYFGGNKATENAFLVRYDLPYRIRRLSFVLYEIDRLHSLDKDALETLKKQGIRQPPKTNEEKEAFRAGLAELRTKLNEVLADLRRARERLKLPKPENPLSGAVRDVAVVDQNVLEALLEKPTGERRDEAKRLVSSPPGREAFCDLTSTLAEHIAEHTNWAAATCENILGIRKGPVSEGRRGLTAARDKVRHLLCAGEPREPRGFSVIARDLVRDYYESYDRYDLISFPILFATEVGEEIEPVEVVRVSPEDADSLEHGRLGIRKLAGTALRGFGAFLDRGWRRNDILWGRLDGAERIIATLVPGSSPETQRERERLTNEAHLAILTEEVGTQDRDRLSQLLVDAMAREDPADPNEAALRKLAERDLGAPTNPKLAAVLRESLSKDTLLDFYGRSYEVNREVDRKATLRTLARSTQVTGDMFEGIAGEGRRGSGLAAWVARAGRLFSGLAEVSTRGSIPNVIWRHWLVLLYAIEVALIVVGIVFSSDQVYRAGLAAFGVTALFHIGSLALYDYMRGTKRWWLSISFAALILLIILPLVALGVYHLVYYALDDIRDALSSAWGYVRDTVRALI